MRTKIINLLISKLLLSGLVISNFLMLHGAGAGTGIELMQCNMAHAVFSRDQQTRVTIT